MRGSSTALARKRSFGRRSLRSGSLRMTREGHSLRSDSLRMTREGLRRARSYSLRRTAFGSARIALTAGTALATSATNSSITATIANTAGSLALCWKSNG